MLNSSTSVDWSGNDFTVFDDFPTTSKESHRRTSYLNRKRYKKLQNWTVAMLTYVRFTVVALLLDDTK